MKKEYLYGIIAIEVIIGITIAIGFYFVLTSDTGVTEDGMGREGGVVETVPGENESLPPLNEGAQDDASEGSIGAVGGKLKADVFTGKLEKVDTGCFADGICSVVVSGKYVMVLTGMRINPQPVGSVQGVEGFGDLESHIGSDVEVYAQVNPDNTYTLYGSEGFYIKLQNDTVPAKPVVGAGCVVGGCSSQLCVDASRGDVVSTCEYSEVYACYQSARCEKQANGQCGWTEDVSLKQCIASKGSAADLQVQ